MDESLTLFKSDNYIILHKYAHMFTRWFFVIYKF